MPTSMLNEILEFTWANDKALYRVTMEAVAQSRKVRSVFLERQPRSERHTVMANTLTRPPLIVAANNLISNWLIKKHTSVLTDFLDALKIPHEKGVVEDLPKEMEDAALTAAIDNLLAKYPHNVVVLYLHAFNDMNEAHWPNLTEKLKTDARLHFENEPAPTGQ